jgi:thiol-disulfide isomerase/thioredoxin
MVKPAAFENRPDEAAIVENVESFDGKLEIRTPAEATVESATVARASSIVLNIFPPNVLSIPRDPEHNTGVRAAASPIVNATIGFERLAAELGKPGKSLHRMLGPRGTDEFGGYLVKSLGQTLRSGDRAPDFSLTGLDGTVRSLSEMLREGPVLLAFFKISCPTCQLTIPYLARLSETETRFVGISQDDAPSTRAFISRFAVAFDVVLDPSLVRSMPLCLVNTWRALTRPASAVGNG